MASVIEHAAADSGVGSAAPRPMVVAQNAHVTYRVYASGKRMSARDSMLSTRAFRGGRDLQTVPAVRGISFTASEGETIGVVGHNGSGKSTLFGAISGLIPTSQGAIWAADRPVLLGVNAALVPELSGENNIKLGLLAMGFTPDEAAAHVEEIADFAELNDFLYHPMKTYSSGMGARLRFAIASAKAHSILLIDEALAVGDRRFKLKSEQRIRELRDTAGLVMIVSHSVGSLRDTCDRVLWIHKGELREDGPADAVVDEYIKWTKNPGSSAVGAASATRQPAPAEPVVPDAARASDGAPRGPRESDGALATLEKLLADAAVEVKEVVVPSEGVRTLARRERHRRSAREHNRRRAIVVAVTGFIVLLAIGAGAAIALLSGVPAASEVPTGPGTAAAQPVPALPVETGAAVPVVAGFAADVATVVCGPADEGAPVRLSWRVGNAVDVAVAGAATGVDAFDSPLGSGLPVSAAEYAVQFPCEQSSWAYTLTAQGSDGSRVSSVVTVTREPSEQSSTDPNTETDQSDQGSVPPPADGGATDTPTPSPSPSESTSPSEGEPGTPTDGDPTTPTPSESSTPTPDPEGTPSVDTPPTDGGGGSEVPPSGGVQTP